VLLRSTSYFFYKGLEIRDTHITCTRLYKEVTTKAAFHSVWKTHKHLAFVFIWKRFDQHLFQRQMKRHKSPPAAFSSDGNVTPWWRANLTFFAARYYSQINSCYDGGNDGLSSVLITCVTRFFPFSDQTHDAVSWCSKSWNRHGRKTMLRIQMKFWILYIFKCFLSMRHVLCQLQKECEWQVL